jgi:predicted amidohydrolase YtcJ
VQLMVSSDALHPLTSHPEDRIGFGLDLGVRTGFGDDHLRLGAMKIFLDGSLIGRTAAVSEAFCGSGHELGSLQLSRQELTARIVNAHRSGWTVAAHAIGDRAIDVALDAFDAAQADTPREGVRHRIEHAGIVRPDQLERFRALGVTPVPQFRFLYEMGSVMLDTVGPGRESLIYRHQSFLDAGVRVPGSSDRPVAAGAPLLGMQSMVQRRTASGRVMSPGERVDAWTALRAYTVDAAWIAGEEDRRGTLEPGKLADLVLLSENPAAVQPGAIGQIEVLATFVGGRCVHGTDVVSSLEVE